MSLLIKWNMSSFYFSFYSGFLRSWEDVNRSLLSVSFKCLFYSFIYFWFFINWRSASGHLDSVSWTTKARWLLFLWALLSFKLFWDRNNLLMLLLYWKNFIKSLDSWFIFVLDTLWIWPLFYHLDFVLSSMATKFYYLSLFKCML